jgi:hypothetical protein
MPPSNPIIVAKKNDISDKDTAIFEGMPILEKKSIEETSLRPNPPMVIGRLEITPIIGMIIKKYRM